MNWIIYDTIKVIEIAYAFFKKIYLLSMILIASTKNNKEVLKMPSA